MQVWSSCTTQAQDTLLVALLACSPSWCTANEPDSPAAKLNEDPLACDTWLLLDVPAQVIRRALCILQKPHSLGAKQDTTKRR